MNTFYEENLDDLVSSCGEGDPMSLKLFFDQYSMNIYFFPIKVFHLSEDEAGDFFIYAFERLKDGKKFRSYNRISSFKTWFYTVLRNLLIDWKKTRHEVQTVSAIKKNKDGVVYHTIEMEPDPRSIEPLKEREEFNRMNRVLGELKLEQRVLFKLAYVFYLNLDSDEIDFLVNKTGLSLEALTEKIFEIRGDLANKREEDLSFEAKLTYLHTQIKELEMKISADGLEAGDGQEIKKNVILGQISKKKQQRKNLLMKRNRAVQPVRTPFKILAELLDVKELTISLLLSRILQKLEVLLKNQK